jgi:HD-GYP domain-containing protein (c-di-GMP phosphodiesterase class II)
MKMPFGSFRTTIRSIVVAVFVISTLLTAGVAIGLQYYFGKSNAKEAARQLYENAAASIANELTDIGRRNLNIIELLADNEALAEPENREEQLRVLVNVLRRNPLFYSAHLGWLDGRFFQVINLGVSVTARRDLDARIGDRWLAVSVSQGRRGWERHFQYFDEELGAGISRVEPTNFDVTDRPWFKSALGSNEMQRTMLYKFSLVDLYGRTISRRIGDTEAVVGIDMTLSAMSRLLYAQAISEHGDIYVFTRYGRVIASSRRRKPGSAPPGEGAGWSGELPTNAFVEIAAEPLQHGLMSPVEIDGEKYLVYVAATDAQESDPVFVGILAPATTVVTPYLQRAKLSIFITGAFLLLLLPLSWFFASPIVNPIRQLIVENDKVRRRQYDKVARIRSHVREVSELSGSMVGMVAAIRAHELAQRNLMDSFIRLIAQAIDDKSPSTGGHCERVPELAMMLAETASGSDHAAFRDFRLESEDEWREYRIAAWLHDCGKITTPEHIVDKGSKLETIYNRIHEVRTRFEVLWRDAEIDYWRKLREAPGEEKQFSAELVQEQEALRADFAFVAECNVGGEFLTEEKQHRLREIGRRTWMRHFDERLGLSPVEETRLPTDAQALPATEQLLCDKPEHIIERLQSRELPPELGIRMEIPEHLYNLGELYNLCISRGTLTKEDRFKINEHMISTIKMLESLPFPEELRNVPRYASTHHETMDGTGYPRRLPGEALSIPERILAVADVFEALTASDRPYKKAKTISEAISILHRLVQDNHIDRDCFELFVREKVYLQYARKFLAPEQIDELDESEYLQAV